MTKYNGYIRFTYKYRNHLPILFGGISSIRDVSIDSHLSGSAEGVFDKHGLDLVGTKNGSDVMLVSPEARIIFESLNDCYFADIDWNDKTLPMYSLIIPERVELKSDNLFYSFESGYVKYSEIESKYMLDGRHPYLINGKNISGNSHFITIGNISNANIFISVELTRVCHRSNLKGFLFDRCNHPDMGDMVSRL